MIFNTNIAIALKNFSGEYEIKELTIFEMENLNKSFPSIEVNINKSTEIVMKVKCPLCLGYHFYNYTVNDIIKRHMVIGGCEELGIPIFFIGKSNNVEQKVSEYKQSIKELYAMI